MLLALALAQLVVSEKVAIVLMGSPALSSDSKTRKRWYRCMSDGMRMANIFERSGYKVNCIFSPSFAQVYGNHFESIGTEGRNWMLNSKGQLFQSMIDDSSGKFINANTIIDAIKRIDLKDGDEVAVYVRAHGHPNIVGLMNGIIVPYTDIVKAFEERPGKYHFLWIFDACYSGTVLDYGYFERLEAKGSTSIVITSTKNFCPSISDWKRRIKESTREGEVRSPTLSSWFRHFLILEIQGLIQERIQEPERRSFSNVAKLVRDASQLPVQYRTFGKCNEDSTHWISKTCDEPVLAKTTKREGHWQAMVRQGCGPDKSGNWRPHHKRRRHHTCSWRSWNRVAFREETWKLMVKALLQELIEA